MSQRDEQISALLDNALDDKEINAFMQDLKRDPLEDAERMQRYQMIGDVVRDELNEASFMDVSAAVHRAIDQEAAIDTQVVKQPAKVFDLSAWTKPLTGMAIAASVAMVTVVAVRTVNTPSADNPVQVIAETASTPVSTNVAAVTPVNPAIAQHVRAASTDTAQQNQLRNRQLNDYMIDHSGFAGQSTMQGMMPYVRVVSFDNQARP